LIEKGAFLQRATDVEEINKLVEAFPFLKQQKQITTLE
jgi:hypothetical protein